MSGKIKVLVVDDQYVSRSFFEIHVGMTKRYELVASLAGAEQAVSWCMHHPVDLVIMDVMMKRGLDGLTCARTIKNNHPKIKIILTTSMAETRWIVKARKAKIDSFWFKEYSDIPLTEVMARTMNGESVYPDIPPNPDFGEITKRDLSDRELDVIREMVKGVWYEDMAVTLHLSINTAKYHVKNILQKTGFRNTI